MYTCLLYVHVQESGTVFMLRGAAACRAVTRERLDGIERGLLFWKAETPFLLFGENDDHPVSPKYFSPGLKKADFSLNGPQIAGPETTLPTWT